jgi:hypothetical protein
MSTEHVAKVRLVTPRRFAAVVTAVVVGATLLPLTSPIDVTANAAATTTQTWKIGRGVKLTRIRYPDTPNEVRVVTLLPQRGPTLDPVGAGSSFPMYELSSKMSANNGAIAGTNGDFATSYGAPVHTFMVDGELWTSGSGPGALFGITPNGTRAFVGRPTLRMVARSKGTPAQRIANWNAGVPEMSTVHAYTVRGGTAVPPPGQSNPSASDPTWCAARLAPTTGYRWAGADRTAIERVYAVQAQACAKTKMGLGSDANVVLASKGTDGSGSAWIQTLTAGKRVKLQYGFPQWPGVTDVGGGNTMLVNRGENVAPAYYNGAPNVLWYNPRTSVGVNAGCGDTDRGTVCKVYVITVDGRQGASGWSKGMQLPRLAKEHLNLGVRFAVNLDGGASTVMWVKRRNDAYCQTGTSSGGCLASRPSASFGERVTITGLSVLGAADPNTPAGLR